MTRKPPPMSEPEYFCPQCGPLRGGVSYDGPPIDEDGYCTQCGSDTCTWTDLVEHVQDEGFDLRRVFTCEPDTGQPVGLQPDGSYVIAPGRGFRSLHAFADMIREVSSTEGREPDPDLPNVVRRAYFHMLTGEAPMPGPKVNPAWMDLTRGRSKEK